MEGLFRRSIADRTPVEMIYMSEKDIVTKRVVTVRQVNEDAITAFCHMRQAVRTFNRLNILSALPVKRRSWRQDDQIG
ncbi:hypothetical protein [Alteribacter keqinensis]|uniref:WYL domain-containing protein n=1 Tax=Alteribacter keqinensis TaxID=2483800 RepID=A0A3M7TW86_9BACI|nr:hypothetical protein [Alteribacter keqinensis]RNA69838.1 hypothetical protein EBO34_07860 [Alteribacter keqinensis]